MRIYSRLSRDVVELPDNRRFLGIMFYRGRDPKFWTAIFKSGQLRNMWPCFAWVPFGDLRGGVQKNHSKIRIRAPFITRHSSGDEIANVNFLYDDIIHVLQNTIDTCINSATDPRGYVLERMFTKFSEITQYNGHYAVQGHSRLPILVPIESPYATSY